MARGPNRQKRFGNVAAFLEWQASRPHGQRRISDRRDVLRISEDFEISADRLRNELAQRKWWKKPSANRVVIFWMPPRVVQ